MPNPDNKQSAPTLAELLLRPRTSKRPALEPLQQPRSKLQHFDHALGPKNVSNHTQVPDPATHKHLSATHSSTSAGQKSQPPHTPSMAQNQPSLPSDTTNSADKANPSSRSPSTQAPAALDVDDAPIFVPAHQFYSNPKPPSKPPKPLDPTANRPSPPPHNPPADCPIKHFPLQHKAFDYIDTHPHSQHLRVFAVESSTDGKRSFLVTTPHRFWQHYIQEVPPQHRHHYEIIRQGSPCHLYFDLEYHKQHNPAVQGDKLVDLLVELLGQQLQQTFGLLLQPHWVLELDSSTETKFSRHLHVHIPGYAWQDNAHVGAFVRQLCAAAVGEQQQGPAAGAGSCSRYSCFLVNKDHTGQQTLFIDTGVYTRNRAFRLFLSSKYGKAAKLTATKRFASSSSSRAAAPISSSTFYASLITHYPYLVQHTSSCPPPPPAAAAAAAARRHHDVQLLTMFSADTTQQQQQQGSISVEHLRAGVPRGSSSSSSSPAMGPSPFPQLEAFLQSVCCQGGVQGEVRSWLVGEGAGTIMYNMKHNRWCARIGGPHKSNGIYLLADLAQGTWCQRCYDPDCRGWRSELMPLPAEVWDSCRRSQQQQQQQQGRGIVQGGQQQEEVAAEESDADFDEYCLRLLDQLDQKLQRVQSAEGPHVT